MVDFKAALRRPANTHYTLALSRLKTLQMCVWRLSVSTPSSSGANSAPHGPTCRWHRPALKLSPK